MSALDLPLTSAPPVLAAAAEVPVSVWWLMTGLALLAVSAGLALWGYARHARALRASEERFRALFDDALEGVYEWSPVRGFTRVNPSMARLLGYRDPAEVLRLSVAECAQIYVSGARREEFFRTLGQQGAVSDFKSEIRRPDGTSAWINESARATRDDGGELLFVQGFVSDVTGERAAVAALRASEERFRVLFEHLPIGIVEYDYRPIAEWVASLRAQGVTDLGAWLQRNPEQLRALNERVAIVGANVAALRLFGLQDLAEARESLDRIFTAELYAARQHTLLAFWEQRRHAEGEFTVRAPGGASLRIYYYWRIPVVDGRLLCERTQLALVDVTALKTAESALAAERERLSVTLRAMSEAVLTVDPAGAVQFMNEAAAELTGWRAAEAVGRSITEVCVLTTGEAGRRVLAPATTTVHADRAIDLPAETAVESREGARRRVEGRCAPMHDASGRVIGAVLVLRDVTERLQLEADLLRASKMESVGRLAGGIAHDFNNHLSVVMGNLALALLEERAKEAAGPWLREAERATMRARDLTQQLLTFAKGGEPVRTAVPLEDVVREAADLALHGMPVRCAYDFAPDLPPADVDRGQIGQVVQNLVINAAQAMPLGGVVRMRLCRQQPADGEVAGLPAGDYLCLEISDTGPGIPSEHLARVFEPFFSTREYGAGLGLATAYSVVRKHRGHIAVDSATDRGTTFRLWLPVARAERASGASASPFEKLRGRVLFMDDEEPIRAMTKTLLERLGVEATVTSDGAEAVREFTRARVEGRPFDLVIVDLTIPGGMGGAEAMREILKIDPAARGIVSSGYSSNPVMANYRAHGFRGMVPKPYRIADLTRTIREVLDGG